MPNASIILTGLAANYPIPGNFLEIDFAQGPAAGAGSPRTAIIMGNMTTSGTATANTVIYGPDTQTPCQTENDVINLFGSGSQIHRAFLRFTAINKVTTLYFIAIAESGGAQATLGETIATTATSNGNHRTWCVDQFVDTAISNGDTATTIAGNIVTSVNSQTRWPVTASNVAGVITYTAKNHGPEGNWIRMQALITPATGTIATTTTLTANTFLSGGTTADVNTTALSTIVAGKYYYIILCDSDATNAGRAVTQVNNNAQPTVGIRQRVVFGSMDTLSNTITTATGLNAPRAELVWGPATDFTPLELAANNAALYMLLEAGASIGVARKNFSNFPATQPDQTLWNQQTVPPGRAGVGGAPTTSQLVSALNNGITPISVSSAGGSYLVKRVTTRSLNGTTSDYRVRDAHKVSVPDYYGDDVLASLSLQCGGKDLLPDPLPGQIVASTNWTSPRVVAGIIKSMTTQYGNGGQWTYPPAFGPPQPGQTPADVINANTIVQAETNPPTRVSALIPVAPVNILDQLALLVQQVG